LTICTEDVPKLEHCSKIVIQSNKTYLKHLKDWFPSWKKNKFCIDNTTTQPEEEDNPGFFNYAKMCSFYFLFHLSNTNEKESTFRCSFVSEQSKSMFERLLERPNTDLIQQCSNFFDDSKLFRFV
jgi:hypothetical protein